MKVSLLAVGTRMPGWVQQGVDEYARRMQGELRFSVSEVALPRRVKNQNIDQLVEKEGAALAAKIVPGHYVVALDVGGRSLSTPDLARRLQSLQEESRDLCLLVGGPDGLHKDCLAGADERWSLSALTLPHPLVRIVVAEQLYRAWSLLKGHPYHRP